MKERILFNRVTGLKFIYDNFPYLYNSNRIELHFVKSKNELLKLNFDDKNFDIIILKRSANKYFINDIEFKDNRFFHNLEDVKKGIDEFDDIFDYCVECHKFKTGENYYSDKLAIAQFSTRLITESRDRVCFIPSIVPGVNTRDNIAYMEINYPYDSENIYCVNKTNDTLINEYGFNNYQIDYLATKIHKIIDEIRNLLLQMEIYNDFQLIIRIDSYSNLLPIDFRTPDAWLKNNN